MTTLNVQGPSILNDVSVNNLNVSGTTSFFDMKFNNLNLTETLQVVGETTLQDSSYDNLGVSGTLNVNGNVFCTNMNVDSSNINLGTGSESDEYSVAIGTNSIAQNPRNVVNPIDGLEMFLSATTNNSNWVSVVWGYDKFVAVANSTGSDGKVMTSSNGVNWTTRTTPENNNLQSVTWGNNMFVAVGTNFIMTSSNGITWTTRTTPENNNWKSVTWGNNMFVAVATTGTNRVMTSLDGFTWTVRTAAESNSWMSVTWGNNLFVAVANSGTNRVMISSNGINWGRYRVVTNPWVSVTWGNNVFVAVASNGAAGGTNRVMTSSNGRNWTTRQSFGFYWWSVTWGNNMFVAVGQNFVMKSLDGITWVRHNSPVNFWNSVTWGNDMFVAVSISGSLNRAMYAYEFTDTHLISIGHNVRAKYPNAVAIGYNAKQQNEPDILLRKDQIVLGNNNTNVCISGNLVVGGNITQSSYRSIFKVTATSATFVVNESILRNSAETVELLINGNYSTNTGRFIATIAGVYRVHFGVRFPNDSTIQGVTFTYIINGVTSSDVFTYQSYTSITANRRETFGSTMKYLNVGDSIYPMASVAGATNGLFFFGFLIV